MWGKDNKVGGGDKAEGRKRSVSESATNQVQPKSKTLRRFPGATSDLQAFVLSQVPKSEGPGAPRFLCGEVGHPPTDSGIKRGL